MSSDSLTDKQKRDSAWQGLSDLEDIIIDIGDFAETLRICARSDQEISPAAPTIIAYYLSQLSKNADKINSINII